MESSNSELENGNEIPQKRVRRKRKLQDHGLEDGHSRKWSESEMNSFLECLKRYGHKNFRRFSEYLPNRSLNEIKCFLRSTNAAARKLGPKHEIIDSWMQTCVSETNKHNLLKYGETLQIAQVMKYLSVDGLLENHPLPERCDGIDFAAAYRLLHQALMGYPLQPVNTATAEFICETVGELNLRVKNDTDVISTVRSFLKQKFQVLGEEGSNDAPGVNTQSSKPTETPKDNTAKKPIKVYQRKRNTVPITEPPALSLTVEASDLISSSALKNFSVSVDGTDLSSSVNVPMAIMLPQRDDEGITSKLFQSIGYNPLQVPEKWLREPFDLKLLRMTRGYKPSENKAPAGALFQNVPINPPQSSSIIFVSDMPGSS